MNSRDKIIRNPARSIPKPAPNFEPEYVRLGREPMIMDERGRAIPLTETSAFDQKGYDANGNEVYLNNDQIIDNNDIVDLDSVSIITPTKNARTGQPGKPAQVQSNIEPDPEQPQVGDYILMVYGKLIASGDIELVEGKVKSILYKEDEEFADVDLGIDDIVVLKRVDIKVGVFLGE